jgi:hypothetical protein
MRMADLLQHENIVVSERGVFEVRSGKQIDGVLRPEIAEIRIAYVRAGNYLIVQGIIGIVLLALGFCGAWWQSQESFHYFGSRSPESVLVGMGIVGVVVLCDVLMRRYVLLVTARDGRCHKLLFSRDAVPSDIEPFLLQVRQTFGLKIHSDVKDIRT